MNVAALVGLLVVAYATRYEVRVLLHYVRHPGVVWHASRIREVGLVDFVRTHPIVPYGFSRPTRWTTDAPTDPCTKHDALPVHIIEMLTRHDALGRRLGTSLFIESEGREARKRVYLAALTTEAVEEYREHMRAVSGVAVRTCADALRLACELTWRLHFDAVPTEADVEVLVRMCDALTASLHGTIFLPSLRREKRVVRAAVDRATGGMVRRWRDAGMSAEDAYVELAHNLFGMTLQWAHLLRRLSAEENPTTLEDAAHFVLDDPPAKVATSRVKNALVVHDLEARCALARRPVRFAAAVEHPHHSDQPRASEDDAHYVPFGAGARRCPGEWLTYMFLMTMNVYGAADMHDEKRLGVNMCPFHSTKSASAAARMRGVAS